MNLSDLTVEACRAKLLDIVERHPRRKNPRNAEGACLYTKGKRHCLIGQMMVEFGIPVPTRGPRNTERVQRLFQEMREDVKVFLGSIQSAVDDPQRLTWGSMAHRLSDA